MPAGIAAFWMLSLALALTPGADWAYAISAGLRYRTVVPAVSGLLLGHLAATLVVAAGVATLIVRSPTIMTMLTTAGAAYLVWLGISTLTRPSTPHAGSEPSNAPWVRQAAKGAGISGLNPKVFLLFLALLPQFTDPRSAWPIGAQILLLGLVHVATCAVVYTGVGTGARVVLSTRPAAARVVTRISGAAMTGLGMILLVEQLIK
jgi:threonine/homoserine/homoserine lactone efflux protein